MKLLLTLSAAVGLMAASVAHAAVDDAKAQSLLKSSGCFGCHAVDKKKQAISFQDVAKKYKGKADAQDKLVKHVTLKPTVELGGEKITHKALKSTDTAEVANVVQWILSR